MARPLHRPGGRHRQRLGARGAAGRRATEVATSAQLGARARPRHRPGATTASGHGSTVPKRLSEQRDADRREENKGRRKEEMLTSRQPCSGTPRVAASVDDRLAVHPRAPSARTRSQRFTGLIDGAAAYPSLCPTEA